MRNKKIVLTKTVFSYFLANVEQVVSRINVCMCERSVIFGFSEAVRHTEFTVILLQ